MFVILYVSCIALLLCTQTFPACKFIWQLEWEMDELHWFLEGGDEIIGKHIC